MITVFFYCDRNQEVGVEPFQSDPKQRTFLALIAEDIITHHSRKWPTFGDRDEEIGYVLPSIESFTQLKTAYPDLDYYQIDL